MLKLTSYNTGNLAQFYPWFASPYEQVSKSGVHLQYGMRVIVVPPLNWNWNLLGELGQPAWRDDNDISDTDTNSYIYGVYGLCASIRFIILHNFPYTYFWSHKYKEI